MSDKRRNKARADRQPPAEWLELPCGCWAKRQHRRQPSFVPRCTVALEAFERADSENDARHYFDQLAGAKRIAAPRPEPSYGVTFI